MYYDKRLKVSLAVPPLRMERKGLGNVAYTTCTRWNASLVTRRSLHKRVLAINTTCLCEYLISIIIMDALCVGCGEDLSLKPKEKRILGSESSKPVLVLWKALFIQ